MDVDRRKLVTCGECQHFEKPFLKNPNRIKAGKCLSFEKGKETTKSILKIEAAYKARGNCQFLSCTKRYCIKFEQKQE